jgi:hypothetical protein
LNESNLNIFELSNSNSDHFFFLLPPGPPISLHAGPTFPAEPLVRAAPLFCAIASPDRDLAPPLTHYGRQTPPPPPCAQYRPSSSMPHSAPNRTPPFYSSFTELKRATSSSAPLFSPTPNFSHRECARRATTFPLTLCPPPKIGAPSSSSENEQRVAANRPHGELQLSGLPVCVEFVPHLPLIGLVP